MGGHKTAPEEEPLKIIDASLPSVLNFDRNAKKHPFLCVFFFACDLFLSPWNSKQLLVNKKDWKMSKFQKAQKKLEDGLQVRLNPLVGQSKRKSKTSSAAPSSSESGPSPFPGVRLKTDEAESSSPPPPPLVKSLTNSGELRTVKPRATKSLECLPDVGLCASPSSSKPTGGCQYRRKSVPRFCPAGADEAQSLAERRSRGAEFYGGLRTALIDKMAKAEDVYIGYLESLQALSTLLKHHGFPSITDIFYKIQPLLIVTRDIIETWEKAKANPSEIVQIYQSLSEYAALYNEYIQHRPVSQHALNAAILTLTGDHPAQSVLATAQLDKKLMAPILRLEEYQSALPYFRAYAQTAEAKSKLDAIADVIQARVGTSQQRKLRSTNQQFCLKFQRLLVGKKNTPPPNIISASLHYVGMHKFPIIQVRHLKKEYRPAVLWLFNEKLVVTKDEHQGRYKFAEIIDLSDSVQVGAEIFSPLTSGHGESIPEWCFSVCSMKSGDSSQKISIVAPDSETRKLWMDSLSGTFVDPQSTSVKEAKEVLLSPRSKHVQRIQRSQTATNKLGLDAKSPRGSSASSPFSEHLLPAAEPQEKKTEADLSISLSAESLVIGTSSHKATKRRNPTLPNPSTSSRSSKSSHHGKSRRKRSNPTTEIIEAPDTEAAAPLEGSSEPSSPKEAAVASNPSSESLQ